MPAQTEEFDGSTDDELREETLAVCKPPVKVRRKRGHYRSYSSNYKMMVVQQLATTTAEALSKKYTVPRTTILSWEKQVNAKDRKVAGSRRGVHLR